jgi:hypothetical protein
MIMTSGNTMDKKTLTLFTLWCWLELEKKHRAKRASLQAWRAANVEKSRAYSRAWCNRNPETSRARCRAWKAKNPEKTRASVCAWKAANPDKVRAHGRVNYAAHPEKARANNAAWREENPEYQRMRYRDDLDYRLKNLARNRVRSALRGASKSARTMELIGCPVETLKAHLQKQFLPGMTWENYGKWHVDHIHPCASFDLTNPAEQRICFNYSNLQPLWAKDNLSKGAKIAS